MTWDRSTKALTGGLTRVDAVGKPNWVCELAVEVVGDIYG